MKSKEEIIKYLRELADGGMPKNKIVGLCSNLDGFAGGYISISDYYESWPHYSGHWNYPVPATRKGFSPFAQYQSRRGLWIRKQGKLRRDLCRHIADEMEAGR